MKCPICKKEVEWKGNPNRPFCSERCKLIDLGNWASEKYTLPVEKNVAAEDAREKNSQE
jgi:endogenous inhibitor of DNA gyrase (YacG/DUF329 family)